MSFIQTVKKQFGHKFHWLIEAAVETRDTLPGVIQKKIVSNVHHAFQKQSICFPTRQLSAAISFMFRLLCNKSGLSFMYRAQRSHVSNKVSQHLLTLSAADIPSSRESHGGPGVRGEAVGPAAGAGTEGI